MTESEYIAMRLHVEEDIVNQRKSKSFRFKNAFKYGGKEKGLKGLGNKIISGLGGDGKGARKMLRNAPMNIGKAVINTAVTLPLMAIPGGSLAADAISHAVIKASIKVGVQLVVGPLTDACLHAAEREIGENQLIQGEYNDIKFVKNKILHKGQSQEHHELLRKRIKEQLKDLTKENGFLMIDRNLVKMRDAIKAVKPAKENFEQTLNSRTKSINEKEEAACKFLRAIAESQYYVEKIIGMVMSLQVAILEMQINMNELQDDILNMDECLEHFLIEKGW